MKTDRLTNIHCYVKCGVHIYNIACSCVWKKDVMVESTLTKRGCQLELIQIVGGDYIMSLGSIMTIDSN